DQEGPIDASDLYARRVAAIAERGGARLGYGTTGAPEPDLHHVSLRPSDRHLLGRQLRDLLTTRGRTPKRSIAESAPQRPGRTLRTHGTMQRGPGPSSANVPSMTAKTPRLDPSPASPASIDRHPLVHAQAGKHIVGIALQNTFAGCRFTD